ncbi:MAG: hypothetical protein MUC44_01415 [Beijerinckiaceae bacterium]|nr:hypothetical protein [Beijerinckiaceae bacterium]
MNANARPFVAIAFYMLSLLALIGAFIAFMRMDEDSSEFERFRNQGVVSRALVTNKKNDTIERDAPGGGRRGTSGSRTTSSPIYVLNVRFDPGSTIRYADHVAKPNVPALPAAPPPTGNFRADGPFVGVMWVSEAAFARIAVGDTLVVVNTPFNRTSPKLVADVQAFDASGFYPWIAGFLLLGLVLGLLGRRIGRGR